ncbi:MAG: anthranilate synthase component I family protein, partial [Burkholderiales bacterium]
GGSGGCMMESAYDEGYGNYSFIGVKPLATFMARGTKVQINIGNEEYQLTGDPYPLLEQFSQGHRVFGLIAYDAVRLKEKIPDRHEPLPTPDFLFHIYSTIIRFDHQIQKVTFTHHGSEAELEKIIFQVFHPNPVRQFKPAKHLNIKSNVNDDEFMLMVKKAKEYIKAGDIFQVVLSRTFSAEIEAKPFDIYRALRQLSPTPYLSFFEEADFAIASASPELLVGVKNGIIETVPIAGTCKKGDDINQLLADPKESAEHIMLVDLARNDVGSVATPGSVRVAEFKNVKSYSHVSHIVSRVIGNLDAQYTPLHALKAILPAGTLSGAPKIRAMEIIDELEHSRRGLYGGAIVTIDEHGNLTSSITIRSAVIYGKRVEVRTGAGIVLDSVAEKEAEETKLKARGVIAALELANGGAQ